MTSTNHHALTDRLRFSGFTSDCPKLTWNSETIPDILNVKLILILAFKLWSRLSRQYCQIRNQEFNVMFDHTIVPRAATCVWYSVNNMLHCIYPSIQPKLSIYPLPLAQSLAAHLPHSSNLQIRIIIASEAYNSIPKQLYSQVIIDNLMARTVINTNLLFHTLKLINCINGQTFQLLNRVVVLPLAILHMKPTMSDRVLI